MKQGTSRDTSSRNLLCAVVLWSCCRSPVTLVLAPTQASRRRMTTLTMPWTAMRHPWNTRTNPQPHYQHTQHICLAGRGWVGVGVWWAGMGTGGGGTILFAAC